MKTALNLNFDALVIGAGCAGAAAARQLAEGGRRVLVLERRGHVGGNAYDRTDEHGVLIHQYGPHIFHTNDPDVFRFLSRFTRWRDYQHRVVANIPREDGQGGRMELPVPFNLTALEIAFGKQAGAALGKKLVDVYGAENKVTILELRQSADPELRRVADYVYDHVFVRYTMKQWGQTPEEIDPGTTARVPVFLSRDDRYFQDEYQGMPLKGYTPMYQAMLEHPNIQVRLNVDALSLLEPEGERLTVDGAPFDGPVIYTGQADALFGYKFGPLPYRTLEFRFETLPQTWFQSRGTVNYTVDEDFTRITEFKHLTGQVLQDRTTIVREYSHPYAGAPGQTPYYAVINPKNNALYEAYRALAAGFQNLHLLGRLAEYKYYNMDAITARALALAKSL